MKKKKLFLYFLLPLFLLQFTCPGYSQTDSGIEVEIQLEPIATFTFSEIYRLKEDPDEVYKLSTMTISNDTHEKKELKIRIQVFVESSSAGKQLIVDSVTNYNNFEISVDAKGRYSIDNTKIIIDPSICFGKSGADNIKILKNLDYFIKRYNRVCIGVSNKIFSSEVFKDIKDSELDIVSSAVSSFATFSGVEFIRVHKIEPNHDAVEVSWKTYIS